MRLTKSRSTWACRRLAYLLFGLGASAIAGQARAQEVATAVYVRTDSDKTVVIAPRLRVQAQVSDETSVSATYAADVWTSASIDIRTSASQVPVTEQRDEIDMAVDQEFEDINLTLSYRYSTEPDYVSHGVSGGFSYDFADNNATLALGLSGSTDTVGKAGDPTFAKSVGTLGGRLSFTQVLDTKTLMQAMYEMSRVKGYQASAYRYVPIGGGACTTGADEPPAMPASTVPVAGMPAATMPVLAMPVLSPLCVPEASPDLRLRHALGVEVRRALGGEWSVAGAYRFYLDDWGISSHTIRAELTFAPSLSTILALRYRFYVQGAADQYRSEYLVAQPFMTTDKELSPLTSHRVALELDHVFAFANNRTLTMTVSAAPHYYSYSDFLPLDSITAFEFNTALVFVP